MGWLVVKPQRKQRIIGYYRMYEWRAKVHFAHVQGDLNLRIRYTFEGTFLLDTAHAGVILEGNLGEKVSLSWLTSLSWAEGEVKMYRIYREIQKLDQNFSLKSWNCCKTSPSLKALGWPLLMYILYPLGDDISRPDLATGISQDNEKLCPYKLISTYHAMGKFSRQQTDDIFLFFPRK